MRMSQKGVVATEAILSFGLLLITLLLFWSTVRLIYEKTSLETAAQMGAQGGITYYLRNTPISCSPYASGDRCQIGRDGAVALAESVFANNICDNDRAIGQERGEDIEDCLAETPTVIIECRLIQSGMSGSPWGEDVCAIDNDPDTGANIRESAKAIIIRFRLQGSVEAEGGLAADILDNVLPGGIFETEAKAYGWRRLN